MGFFYHGLFGARVMFTECQHKAMISAVSQSSLQVVFINQVVVFKKTEEMRE